MMLLLLIVFVEYDDEIYYPMRGVVDAFHPQAVADYRLLMYQMYDWKNDVDDANDHSKKTD
jgi:hypothetical protein